MLQKETSTRFPKPGLRILKTGIAVMLCVISAYFRGAYALPFYSSIAAILCTQKDSKAGRKAGLNRMIATLIGGAYGYLICLLSIATGLQNSPFFHNLLAGFAVMPLIYITVLLKQSQVAYIACVVSLSISLTHGRDPNPLAFALNRVIDTLIGVVIAVIVNELPFLRRRPETDASAKKGEEHAPAGGGAGRSTDSDLSAGTGQDMEGQSKRAAETRSDEEEL